MPGDLHAMVLVFATVVAGLCSTSFAIVYSCFQWEKSTEGRHIMAITVAIACRAWLGALARWDGAHDETYFDPWLDPLMGLSWLVIAFVFARAFWAGRRGGF